jgi:hypothetical protein
VQRGGIATSLAETGQQWDGRNAWPPLQAMLAEATAACCGDAGLCFARRLAQTWLSSNLLAWRQHGQMVRHARARPASTLEMRSLKCCKGNMTRPRAFVDFQLCFA